METIEHVKTCRKCREAKPLSEFYKSPSTKDGLYGSCKDCHKAVMRKRYESKHEQERGRSAANRWAASHGLKPSEVKELYQRASSGACDICGRRDHAQTFKGNNRVLALDHDHRTGELRGFLCFACNTAIGKLQDDPALLRKAAEYLENPPLRPCPDS